jgi:multisubunit Na+/H+ antiporter MnhF subunit
LDLLNSLAVGGVVILSIFHNTSLYLDVILGFVLVIFLGTVAYVQYFLSAKRDKS